MATTTITLPNGAAVYHRSPGSIPATTLRRDLLTDQNVANLATAMNLLDLATAIADPGASGAIPVTSSGYVPIVTATAESRTLAVPTFSGQLLLLEMKTDGGDCTITVAQAIDEYGTTNVVLNDAGDAVLLVGVYSGSNLRWRTVANRGVDTVPERGPLESLIADPGNAGAIPVTRSGHVEIVTAAAETRTLAAPSFNGQLLLISMKTDVALAIPLDALARRLNYHAANCLTDAESLTNFRAALAVEMRRAAADPCPTSRSTRTRAWSSWTFIEG
jgi:hypothetical protein